MAQSIQRASKEVKRGERGEERGERGEERGERGEGRWRGGVGERGEREMTPVAWLGLALRAKPGPMGRIHVDPTSPPHEASRYERRRQVTSIVAEEVQGGVGVGGVPLRADRERPQPCRASHVACGRE